MLLNQWETRADLCDSLLFLGAKLMAFSDLLIAADAEGEGESVMFYQTDNEKIYTQINRLYRD